MSLLDLAKPLLALIPGVGPGLAAVSAILPPGAYKAAGIGLALLAGVWWVDHHARVAERGKCNAAAAIAERDHARLEANALREQVARTSAANAEIEAERGKADERATSLEQALRDAEAKHAGEIAKRPNAAGKCPACPASSGPCRLDPDAIRRMR